MSRGDRFLVRNLVPVVARRSSDKVPTVPLSRETDSGSLRGRVAWMLELRAERDGSRCLNLTQPVIVFRLSTDH